MSLALLFATQNDATLSDLTTIGAVRQFLQLPPQDTEQNAIIAALITRASAVITRWTSREFAPTQAGATRTFLYTGGGSLDLSPFELRTVSSVVLDADLAPAAQIPLTPTDYRPGPVTARDGVYQWLNMLTYPTVTQPRVVQVTGTWGWPAVPADVEHAAIVTVATWLKRDVSAFSRTFNIDEGRTERPDALPSAVTAILGAYRVPVIA